jgi:phosphatidylglycerol:prolipoprotein diacylglycerol transferase
MNNFTQWWQHLPDQMNPVIFSIGSFSLQYYGLMYLVAFSFVYVLASYRLRREPRFNMDSEKLQELMVAMILGIILGARFGYVLFYNFAYYMHNPLEIILPFDISDGFRFTGIAGMSFHGGLIGVLLGTLYFSRKNKIPFLVITDLIAPCVPLGYTFGRLGNFINGELYGRVSSVPWAMVFPGGGPLPRHPSQIYEVLLEGILLFTILWILKEKPWQENSSGWWPHGAMLALFLCLYGIFRFLVEFVREPDPQLGRVLSGMTMGQLLSLAMVTCGILLWLWRRKATEVS